MASDNRYKTWIGTELDRCRPIVDAARLSDILMQTTARAWSVSGPGELPKVSWDLEQLQVADYAALEGISDAHRAHMARLLAQEPIRTDEVIFLSLRSLYQLTWPEPQSQDDLLYILNYEDALSAVLVETAMDVARQFLAPAPRLPYWGRLSFLRVMGLLPTEVLTQFGLDAVSCALLRRAKFNATTFALADGALIGMNYALEPVLKHLNRLFMAFHSTQHLASDRRALRAWKAALPVVLHFWSDIAANHLTRAPLLIFQESAALSAHTLTWHQLDFIVAHELGHVALEHPQRLGAAHAEGRGDAVRHEFEHAADAFALRVLRPQLGSEERPAPTRITPCGDAQPGDTVPEPAQGEVTGLAAVGLLFVYMNFIQRAGELLHARLGASAGLRPAMDSHPRASLRLERLQRLVLGTHIGETQIERYAAEFFALVLSHVSSLEDDALAVSLQEARSD
jgi:hypothetical protein